MTDFDPNKKIQGAQFNQSKQGRAQEPEATEETVQGPAVDPYADQKIDADKVLELLAKQGKLNFGSASNVENVPIVQSVMNFAAQFPPQRHAELLGTIKRSLVEEFGLPKDSVQVNLAAQDILDDLIIGRPVVTL